MKGNPLVEVADDLKNHKNLKCGIDAPHDQRRVGGVRARARPGPAVPAWNGVDARPARPAPTPQPARTAELLQTRRGTSPPNEHNVRAISDRRSGIRNANRYVPRKRNRAGRARRPGPGPQAGNLEYDHSV